MKLLIHRFSCVIPAKAGIHRLQMLSTGALDRRFRWGDAAGVPVWCRS
jgi:hypothetical protein